MAGRAKENLPGGSLKCLFVYLKIRIFKCSYRIYIYTYGGFLKQGYPVPLNHPFIDGFSIINHSAIGYIWVPAFYGNTHIYYIYIYLYM